MEEQNLGENLIAMSGQDGTFAVNRRSRCKGYLKIEASRGKGMVWIAAENLRFFEKEQYSYKLILFGKKKMQTVFKVFGSLPVDSSGRGEAHFAFDPKDVDGKGSSLTDFSLAIVAAASQTDPKETLHPVLRGNLSREYLRQSRPAAAAQQKPPEKTAEKAAVKPVTKPVDKPAEKAAGRTSYNDYYRIHLLEGCRSIENKLNIYDGLVPFKEDRTGAKWKRIVNLSKFPLLSKGAQYGISRYRHFIFGVTEEHDFIGVPGRFLEEEQPERGASGFVLWQPVAGAEGFRADRPGASTESRQAAYGYWIAAVNRKTGVIECFACSPFETSGCGEG